MIQFALYGLLFSAVAIDAGFFDLFASKKVSFNFAAEARRLVHQGKWATFTTISANGYPRTTVLSTADNHNGEIFFFMLDVDTPAMDPSNDNRITFTFSDVERVRYRFRSDEPTFATAMVSGHVKKLESRTERIRGLKAFLCHHPEVFEWDRSSLFNFFLCKLDVTNVLVFLHNGEVGQVSSQEYYAATTDSAAISASKVRQIGTQFDVAAEARRLVHHAKWATFTNILVDGYPMTTVLSTAENNGEIFFYLLDVNMPAINTNNDNRMPAIFSDAQEVDCNDGRDDPWSPNCAKAVISGYVNKVEVGTKEHNRSLEAFLSCRPNAFEFGSSNFNLYKLNVTNVVVLFRYGGGGQVSSKEYYAQNDFASIGPSQYLMKQIGTRPDIAAEARRLVHQAKNVTTVIYLGERHAVVYFLSVADRKGQIYFYVSNKDAPAVDTNKNNTFEFSDNQAASCKQGNTWSPHCARAMISGTVKKLDIGTEEHTRCMDVFLWRHPAAISWGSSELDFFLWKLDITNVKVQFFHDTSPSTYFVTSQEYYAGTESVHVNGD